MPVGCYQLDLVVPAVSHEHPAGLVTRQAVWFPETRHTSWAYDVAGDAVPSRSVDPFADDGPDGVVLRVGDPDVAGTIHCDIVGAAEFGKFAEG